MKVPSSLSADSSSRRVCQAHIWRIINRHQLSIQEIPTTSTSTIKLIINSISNSFNNRQDFNNIKICFRVHLWCKSTARLIRIISLLSKNKMDNPLQARILRTSKWLTWMKTWTVSRSDVPTRRMKYKSTKKEAWLMLMNTMMILKRVLPKKLNKLIKSI
jgi:hypothetical protein